MYEATVATIAKLNGSRNHVITYKHDNINKCGVCIKDFVPRVGETVTIYSDTELNFHGYSAIVFPYIKETD